MRMNAAQRIAENVAALRMRIVEAAARSGHPPAGIQLVAVTKYVDEEMTRLVVDAGCHDLGESRPQQLWEKAEALADQNVRWHMVGHLQRNKIRRTLPCASLIHSVDGESTLLAIHRIAGELGIHSDVLLEVNLCGEEAKHGLASADVEPLLETAADLSSVRIRGLMTMAALEGGADVARRNFADLRELRDRLLPNCPEGVSLRELSMGMSDDFEVAIEEGATIVRVGSVLFQGLQ